MRIMIVDDSPLFANGLKNLLVANDQIVTAVAYNVMDAISMIEESDPDVVLLDIEMPEVTGIDAIKFIKEKKAKVKIVMLTVMADDEHLFQAIKNGADGYLIKGTPPKKFLACLMKIKENDAPLSAGLSSRILKEFSQMDRTVAAPKEIAPLLRLNEKQKYILKLVAAGRAYSDIGKKLGITEGGVKYHMQKILDKLEMENKTQAIAMLIKYEKFNA